MRWIITANIQCLFASCSSERPLLRCMAHVAELLLFFRSRCRKSIRRSPCAVNVSCASVMESKLASVTMGTLLAAAAAMITYDSNQALLLAVVDFFLKVRAN